jgi:pimeloyl-ACP methyl ester carboxylesterase
MNPTHPTQPVLVFIHGFLDGAAVWDDLAQQPGARAAMPGAASVPPSTL